MSDCIHCGQAIRHRLLNANRIYCGASCSAAHRRLRMLKRKATRLINRRLELLEQQRRGKRPGLIQAGHR